MGRKRPSDPTFVTIYLKWSSNIISCSYKTNKECYENLFESTKTEHWKLSLKLLTSVWYYSTAYSTWHNTLIEIPTRLFILVPLCSGQPFPDYIYLKTTTNLPCIYFLKQWNSATVGRASFKDLILKSFYLFSSWVLWTITVHPITPIHTESWERFWWLW